VGKVSRNAPAVLHAILKAGSVIRGSEGNLEVMILGVGVHTAGGPWRVDNVRQEGRSNVLWVVMLCSALLDTINACMHSCRQWDARVHGFGGVVCQQSMQ
jgi:hypothetical protein